VPRHIRFFCRAADTTGSFRHDPAGFDPATRVGPRVTVSLQLSTRATREPLVLRGGTDIVDVGTGTTQLEASRTVAAAAEVEAPTVALLGHLREDSLGGLRQGVIVHVSWDWAPRDMGALLASLQESPIRQSGPDIESQVQKVLASGGPRLTSEGTVRPTGSDVAALLGAATVVPAPSSRQRGGSAMASVFHSLRDYSAAAQLNGLGRYQDAFDAAQSACDHGNQALLTWALVELIEAASRSDRPECARAALEHLEECAPACGNDWAIGLVARSKALLAEGEEAEALFQQAIEQFDLARIVVHLGRAHLVYGEWLRRANRRIDAREQLRKAYEILSDLGATAFAARAQGELLATCETVRKRSVETFGQLTAQETQIACLARDGYTNPEIGARLFISSRTVEWHLRKVFTKLGISSRRALRDALPSRDQDVVLTGGKLI